MRDYNETTFEDLPVQVIENISDHICMSEGRPTYNR